MAAVKHRVRPGAKSTRRARWRVGIVEVPAGWHPKNWRDTPRRAVLVFVCGEPVNADRASGCILAFNQDSLRKHRPEWAVRFPDDDGFDVGDELFTEQVPTMGGA